MEPNHDKRAFTQWKQVEKLILFVVFFAYGALVFFGIRYHEPWRDEAHGWMIAREYSAAQIISNIDVEAVPTLWYFILKPFASAGLPYITMGIVHGTLAVLAIALLLFKSKLPLVLKILIPFSYFVAYEYAVVARNYVLTGLFLYSVAALYPRRFTKPLIYAIPVSLLFQANLHSFGFAAALMALYLYELVRQRYIKRIQVLALIPMLLSMVFSVVTLLRSAGPSSIPAISEYNLDILQNTARQSIVPSLQYYEPGLFTLSSIQYLIPIATYVLIVLMLTMSFPNRNQFLLSIVMIGWIFFINVVVHPAQPRHSGLFLVLIVFLFWLAHEKKLKTAFARMGLAIGVVLFSGLLLISLPYTAYMYRTDYAAPFSSAKDMAEYIKANGLADRTIITFYSSYASALQPYFKHTTFFSPEFWSTRYANASGNVYTQIVYSNKITIWDAIWMAKQNGPDGKPPLLLLSEGIPRYESGNFAELYHSEAPGYWENETENFWLYEYASSEN